MDTGSENKNKNFQQVRPPKKEYFTNEKYSKADAMQWLKYDLDWQHPVSISGYVKQWGWNWRTVKNFIAEMLLKIEYPKGKIKACGVLKMTGHGIKLNREGFSPIVYKNRT